MDIITIEEAVAHCNADSDDTTKLTLCAEAAEQQVRRLLNRGVFATQQALDDAIAAIPAAMAAARAAYADAVALADAMTDEDAAHTATWIATVKRDQVLLEQERNLYGIVVTADIKAATLLIVGHLFANREDVLTGQGANAVEVPQTSRHILWPYTRLAF